MAGANCGAETDGMKRIAVLLAALVLLGGGSGQAATGPLVSLTNGPLPARGLLVVRGQDTLVVGLDGKVHARLAGLRPPWFARGDTARNAAFQQLAAIVPGSVLLSGPAGQWYLFDSRGRLDALTSPRLRFPGGIDVVARTVPTNDHIFQVDVTVERAGRVLVPAFAELRRISGNLAVGQSIAVDLQTGNRWHVAANCYPAATRGSELLMFCGARLLAVSTHGSQTTLATIPKSLFATSASLSPNGKNVVAMFSPGCGPSYGFVVPTGGGVARPLTGEKRWSLAGPNSIALGWTPDNRIVTIVEPSSKLDTEPEAGVYLINPETLTRRLVYPSANPWAMWNAAA
jgi:hypothetical protein